MNMQSIAANKLKQLFTPNIPKMAEKKDVEGLINTLHDRNPDVRQAAAEALGQMGDTTAVNALVEAYKDADQYVRCAVVEALEQLDTTAVLPFMVRALNDNDPYVRTCGAKSLSKIGSTDPRLIKPLLTALKDNDAQVRWYIVEALMPFKDQQVISALIPVLSDTKMSVRKVAMDALVNMGPPALKILIDALQVPSISRADIIEALKNMGDERAIPVFIDVLNSQDFNLRVAAAAALDQIGWAPQNEDETAARYWIAKKEWARCISIGEPAVRPLLHIVKTFGPELCKQAIETLGEMGLPVIESLIVMLSNPNLEVQRAGLDSLKGFEGAGHEDYILPLLGSPDPGIRQRAVAVLENARWAPMNNEAGAAYYIAKSDWIKCILMGAPAVGPLLRELDNCKSKHQASIALRAIYDSGDLCDEARGKIRLSLDKIMQAWQAGDSLEAYKDERRWR